jgi:hypothetical protein
MTCVRGAHRATPKARRDTTAAGAGRTPTITRTARTTLAGQDQSAGQAMGDRQRQHGEPAHPESRRPENRARYAPTPSTSCTAKRTSSVRAAGLMTASPVPAQPPR